MIGLLYKDFVATKAPYYLIGLAVQALILVACRFLILDVEARAVLSVVWIFMFMLAVMVVIGTMIGGSLLKVDEGKKQLQYHLSMPVSRNQYVASKYIFLVITNYICVSIFSFEILFVCPGVQTEMVLWLSNLVKQCYGTIFLANLLLSAIELPFFFRFGVRGGMAVKEGILFALMFAFVVFLLFGDLTIMDTFNIGTLAEYLMKHSDVIMAIQVLFPLIVGVIYFLSYRLSCRLFARKEWDNE